VVIVGVCIASPAAFATPDVWVVEPASWELHFFTPIDGTSEPQRIRLRNDGDPVEYMEVDRGAPPFQIVGEGGGLGRGGEQYWDIVCASDQSGFESQFFDIIICADGCEYEVWHTIMLFCEAGLLRPQYVDMGFPFVYPGEEARTTIVISNPRSTPVTISAIETAAPFTAALETGTLPLTLQPGESVSIAAEFDSWAVEGQGRVDVIGEGQVLARVRLQAITLPAIIGLAFSPVPLGAVYTVPIRIRNSWPTARVITGASFDRAEFSLTDLVGTTLAPGEEVSALASFTATTLGFRPTTLTVTFDSGPAASTTGGATVVPAIFSLETGDSTAGDGWLDFGTRLADGPPVERTFAILNLTDAPMAVLYCSEASGPFERLTECPSSIPPRGRFDFTVRFTPDGLGDFVAWMNLTLEGVGDTTFVPLRATVVDRAYDVAAASLEFADTPRGAVTQEVVTVTNVTADPISLPVGVQGDGFALLGPAVVEVPGEGSVDVTVEFRPAEPGDFAGSLEVGAAEDPNRRSIPLSGRAYAAALACDAELDFGPVEVGTTAEASVTCRNPDAVSPVEIAEVTVEGDSFAVVTPIATAIGPDATVELSVRFTPASTGSATGQLAVLVAGDSAAQGLIALSGEGVVTEPPPPPPDGGDDTGGCGVGQASGTGQAALVLLVALLCRRRRRRR
jgi:hypothetical protein